MEILGVPPSPAPADALQNYTGGNLTVTGPKETASIFATYPAPYLSLSGGFLDQVGARGTPVTDWNFAPALWGPSLLFRLWVVGDGGLGLSLHSRPHPSCLCWTKSDDMGWWPRQFG